MASSATSPQIPWLNLTHFAFMDIVGPDEHIILKFHPSINHYMLQDLTTSPSVYLYRCLSPYIQVNDDIRLFAASFSILPVDSPLAISFTSWQFRNEVPARPLFSVVPVCFSFGVLGTYLQPAFYGNSRVNRGPGAF